MEVLIVTSALLALARWLNKKRENQSASSTSDKDAVPPAVIREPPPPPPPPPPPAQRPPVGVGDRSRLDRARALAVQVAQLIKARGPAYDRNFVAAFQREAGLAPDGVYGPRTAGAVKWYTSESIPPISGRGFEGYVPFGTVQTSAPKPPPAKPVVPVVPPSQPKTAPVEKPPPATAPKVDRPQEPVQPPVPTTATTNVAVDRARLDRAAGLAKQVSESIKKLGKTYDRSIVTAFQREAGLAADGIYGPRTAGAVQWYTGESIPPSHGWSARAVRAQARRAAGQTGARSA